jgi:hypothetical protein
MARAVKVRLVMQRLGVALCKCQADSNGNARLDGRGRLNKPGIGAILSGFGQDRIISECVQGIPDMIGRLGAQRVGSVDAPAVLILEFERFLLFLLQDKAGQPGLGMAAVQCGKGRIVRPSSYAAAGGNRFSSVRR